MNVIIHLPKECKITVTLDESIVIEEARKFGTRMARKLCKGDCGRSLSKNHGDVYCNDCKARIMFQGILHPPIKKDWLNIDDETFKWLIS